MTGRAAAWLAWSIWAVSVSLALFGLVLVVLVRSYPTAPDDIPLLSRYLLYLPTIIAWPTAGALIASRQPRNPIGWLLLASGVLNSLGGLGEGYWRYALFVQPDALPGGLAMLWLNGRLYELGAVMEVLLVLLFPTGRALSPRWWIAGWAAIVGTLIRLVAFALMPGPLDASVTIDNPTGLAGATGLLDTASNLGTLLMAGGSLAAASSLIVRLRRARGIERQQIQVLTYALALYILGTVALAFLLQAPGAAHSPLINLAFVLQAGAGVLVAGAVVVAMRRYRLFDIDVVINRTLVYALLSSMLAALYLVSVVVLQQVFRVVIGEDSDLTVVVSTLFIAVLFHPLRRRVQAFIDRRFYRRHYDAGAILAAHAAALRDEVAVDQVTTALVQAVDGALRPAHVALWVQKPEETR